MATTVESVQPQSKKKEVKEVDKNDHSIRLAAMLPRNPGETVKATKVGSNNYRVNWMAPDIQKGDCVHIQTFKFVKSQFLSVTVVKGDLVIVDVTRN